MQRNFRTELETKVNGQSSECTSPSQCSRSGGAKGASTTTTSSALQGGCAAHEEE